MKKFFHDSKTICGESNLARTRPPVLDLKKKMEFVLTYMRARKKFFHDEVIKNLLRFC